MVKIPAGRFKAICLGLLDQVARTGESMVITKHGKPVARLVPMKKPKVHRLRGSVIKEKDIMAPIHATWDVSP
jgi:prevent-host-death family protein